MTQNRNLIPTSVYLSPEHTDEADKRASERGLARATLLRLILTGHEKPLAVRRSRA